MAPKNRTKSSLDADRVMLMARALEEKEVEAELPFEPQETPPPSEPPVEANPEPAAPPEIQAEPETPVAAMPEQVQAEPPAPPPLAEPEPAPSMLGPRPAPSFDPGQVDGRTLRRTGREPFATRIKPEAHAALKRIAYTRGITIAEALETAVAEFERR